VPQGLEVVDQVSSVFIASYGEWSKALFLIGAFCTLFSTLVVVVAASGRMGADLFGCFGWIDPNDAVTVRRCHRLIQTIWLVGLLAMFLLSKKQPEQLIVSGHFVLGAFLTPLLMCCICWLAFHTDRRVRMSWPTAILLVTSVVIIFACVAINAAVQLSGK
jgi:hypothetical protein